MIIHLEDKILTSVFLPGDEIEVSLYALVKHPTPSKSLLGFLNKSSADLASRESSHVNSPSSHLSGHHPFFQVAEAGYFCGNMLRSLTTSGSFQLLL